MLQGSISLGRIFGISLKLNYTWFIVFALVTWSLTSFYFPDEFPEWNIATSLVAAIITSLLFFSSLLTHELMHSIVAQKLGITIHSITLFIFGGVSQMTEEPRKPQDELRIALAGPLASIVLSGVFYAIWQWSRPYSDFIAAISFWLFWINLFLALFNLIPGFPLDGGRVLRSIMWWRNKDMNRATKIASNIGRGIGYLFIFGGIFAIFQSLWLNGIWLILIGWFLENTAANSYQQVALLDTLQGHTVREVMIKDCPVIPPALTLDTLVNEYILTTGRLCFPITTDGRVVGLITFNDICAVPRTFWSTKRVSDVMIPIGKMKSISPNEDLSTALRVLTEEEVNQVLVIENGSLTGVIGRDNLLSFIKLRDELRA